VERVERADKLTSFPEGQDLAYPGWFTPRWYAAYTFSHHEKRVRDQLVAKRVETFLPLYSTVHRWKNRRAKLELPLFPGYVFVRIPLRDRLPVLQAAGVVRLVGTAGKPTPLEDHEIESLRNACDAKIPTEPHSYLRVGRKVRIKTGPFEGFQGILLRRSRKFRVVLSLELIARSFVLDVDISDLETLKERCPV